MKLKIFSSSFARKSFSNSAKQRIETINTKLPRIRENRTFINRAIYIINEKKKKKKRIISSIIDYRGSKDASVEIGGRNRMDCILP